MSEKRFELKVNQHNKCDIVDWVESKEKNAVCIYNDLGDYYFSSAKALCELLNKLDENWIKELNLRETLQLDLQRVEEENKQLKQLIKKFEKEIHLIHMSSMFSTVKSFNGDVSKRYKYSEENDTIYDTANTYGQYSKILDKKEVVMLLNEYETLLDGALDDRE